MLATAVRVLAIFGITWMTACSNAPRPLVDGLLEGMTETQAIRVIGIDSSSLQVLFENKLAVGDLRPPYSEKTISINSVMCLGTESEMQMSFYLEGLTSVTCYPKNAEALMAALRKQGSVAHASQREFELDHDGVEIRGGQHDGRWAITFTSKRLRGEQQKWISKYS